MEKYHHSFQETSYLEASSLQKLLDHTCEEQYFLSQISLPGLFYIESLRFVSFTEQRLSG